jgi:FeS assembly SUF system protein
MDGKALEDREALKGAVDSLDEKTIEIARPRDITAEVAAASDAPMASSDEAAEKSALPPEEIERLTDDIIAALKTVYDPEIPADIYELGLIYKVEVDDGRNVVITMTLTAPGCPVAGEMPIWVENAVNAVQGVAGTKVNIVFDPPWDQSRMSDEARLAVGMF